MAVTKASILLLLLIGHEFSVLGEVLTSGGRSVPEVIGGRSRGSCLKGWATTLGLNESWLNRALVKLVAETDILDLTINTVYVIEGNWPVTVEFINFRVGGIEIYAMEAGLRVAKVIFRVTTGTIRISIFGNVAEESMDGLEIKFRTSLISYRNWLTTVDGYRYKLKLEIRDENAVIGLKLSNVNSFFIQDVEKGLTAIFKDYMTKGKLYDLIEFDIPGVPENSLLNVLIPNMIDYTFSFGEPSNNIESAFGGLMTQTGMKIPEGDIPRSFKPGELVEPGQQVTATLESVNVLEFMGSLLHTEKPFSESQCAKNCLVVRNSCRPVLALSRTLTNAFGANHLLKLEMTPHGTKEIKLFVQVREDNPEAGINWVLVDLTVRFSIDYNPATRSFNLKKVHEHHTWDASKEWWVELLEGLVTAFTLGFVQELWDGFINEGVQAVLNDSINTLFEEMEKNEFTMSIGGLIGELVDNINFGDIFIDQNGNFKIKMEIEGI